MYSPDLAARYSQERERFNETDKELIEALEAVGVQGKIVVDLGCGDGRHVRLVKEMGASRVTGVDVSPKMIELANEKTDENSDITFLVADGRSIPIESESTDLVISNFVIHYFVDVKEIFHEISRILKEEGLFVGTFNITDVETGFEHLYNQQMPIRLGHGDGSFVVENLIKSRQEIRDAIMGSGLTVINERELDHFNAVVDESFQDKIHIQKHAVLMTIQKNIKK